MSKNEIITRLKNCKSDKTWDVIEAIGWGTKTTDYDAISGALVNVFDQPTRERIEREARAYGKKVYDRAEQEELSGSDNFFGFGDDGWSDATAHIVGLGKETYARFMKNPVAVRDELQAKGGDDWNEENFFYSFHA